MTSRLDWFHASPNAVNALLKTQAFVNDCGLEHSLLELVKLRASQINGCAYCIEMHARDARGAGESEERLILLDAWRDAPRLYSQRERAALGWVEAVTRISEGHAPQDVFECARAEFSDKELTDLTLAIATINSWNRMNIAFRLEAGQPLRRKA